MTVKIFIGNFARWSAIFSELRHRRHRRSYEVRALKRRMQATA